MTVRLACAACGDEYEIPASHAHVNPPPPPGSVGYFQLTIEPDDGETLDDLLLSDI